MSHNSSTTKPFLPGPWLPFVLPFAVFMLIGSLEPKAGAEASSLGLRYEHYPLIYTLKIAAVIGLLAWAWKAYRHESLGSLSRWSFAAIGVGAVGFFVWIGLGKLGLEETLGLAKLLGGERSAYNPLEQLGATPLGYAFLAVRFLGLALVVPIIEEMFLRGFLMRFMTSENWWTLPLGAVSRNAIYAGTLYGMLTHPAELLAAAAWFSLVTWLMLRTKNIWDCVLAHAMTNLLLGVWVVTTGEWHWW